MWTVAFSIFLLIVTLVALPIAAAVSVNRGGPMVVFFRRRSRVIWLLCGVGWCLVAILSFSQDDGFTTFLGWIGVAAALLAFATAFFYRVSPPPAAE